jgi:hypothetical protein
MRKYHGIAIFIGGLTGLGCGGNAFDVGHSQNRGWADAPPEDASATTPQTIYESDQEIFGFALDDNTLYALINHDDTFELVSCELERCRSERNVLFSGPYVDESGFHSTPLVLSDGWLYWISSENGATNIAACPTSGCTQPRFAQAAISSGLAADPEDGVYWVDHEQSSLMRFAVDIDAPESVRGIVTELGGTLALAVHGDYVYVADQAETISRFRKDGTGVREPIATDDMLVAFTVAADGVYYSSQLLTGRIARCPLTGCVATGETLVDNQRWPEGVQVEGNEAFWLTNPRFSENLTHATLHSCRLPDCSSVQERVGDLTTTDIVDSSSQGPTFAVSQRAIVWLEPLRDGTSFRRLPR